VLYFVIPLSIAISITGSSAWWNLIDRRLGGASIAH
jgi:S-disulfanyl-L-cysteine oxidoreductase SoxD